MTAGSIRHDATGSTSTAAATFARWHARATTKVPNEWPTRHGPCSACLTHRVSTASTRSSGEGTRNTARRETSGRHTSAIGRSDRARSRCATVHRYGGRPMPKPWRSTAGVGGDVGRVGDGAHVGVEGSRAGGGRGNGRHPAKHLRVCVACRVLCSSAAAPLTASMPRDEVFSDSSPLPLRRRSRSSDRRRGLRMPPPPFRRASSPHSRHHASPAFSGSSASPRQCSSSSPGAAISRLESPCAGGSGRPADARSRLERARAAPFFARLRASARRTVTQIFDCRRRP